MNQIQVERKNVWNGQQEIKDQAFRFYEIMQYPIPLHKEFFSYGFQKGGEKIKSELSPVFSWSEKSGRLHDFLLFIEKWNWLYSQFPFVKQIFLANSITFNALKATSDIDLFVVTQKGRIWTARLFMSIMMLFFQIKRTQKSEYKKFCLSFFVDEEHLNLENLLLDEKDLYLPYRIAHLVPLYQEQRSDSVFYQNAWIARFLPYFSQKQLIFLGNDLVVGSGFFKQLIEWVLKGKVGIFLERLIKRMRLPRIHKLQKKKPELHQGVIIGDGILKFHYDKRKQYSELFFS